MYVVMWVWNYGRHVCMYVYIFSTFACTWLAAVPLTMNSDVAIVGCDSSQLAIIA